MLLDLPPELIFIIYESLLCLRDVISLRQACRQLDILYRSNATTILLAQRNNIVQPMIQYYTFLTTLHIPAECLKLPPHEIVIDSHLKNKTAFTLDVIRHMPIISRYMQYHPIAVNSRDIDWSEGSWTGRHNTKLGLQRHSVCLTDGVYLVLDTMKAEINGVHVQNFWRRLTDQILSKDLIFIPGKPLAIVNGAYSEGGWENIGYPLKPLLEIYEKHGWPLNFDREKAIEAINAYFAYPPPPGRS